MKKNDRKFLKHFFWWNWRGKKAENLMKFSHKTFYCVVMKILYCKISKTKNWLRNICFFANFLPFTSNIWNSVFWWFLINFKNFFFENWQIFQQSFTKKNLVAIRPETKKLLNIWVFDFWFVCARTHVFKNLANYSTLKLFNFKLEFFTKLNFF